MLSSNRLAPVLSTVGVLGAMLALAGCVDPEGRLNEFLDKTKRGDGGMVNSMCQPIDLPDLNGTFLLSLKIFFISKPVQLLATSTFTKMPDGSGRLSLKARFLTVEGRMPTGGEIVLDEVMISSGGEFTLLASVLMITKEANPLVRDATVEGVKLPGCVLSKDLFCGTAKGTITMPPSGKLEDGEPGTPSTWAVTRVMDMNNLPDPVIACP